MDFKFPELKLGDIIPKIDIPKIPDVNSFKIRNIDSAIDTMTKNSIYNEIDELKFSIKLKETEMNNNINRLNGIKKSDAIRNGIIISIIVCIISVIIPFLIICFNNYLEKYGLCILIYMITSFLISIIILFGYLIYSYKK